MQCMYASFFSSLFLFLYQIYLFTCNFLKLFIHNQSERSLRLSLAPVCRLGFIYIYTFTTLRVSHPTHKVYTLHLLFCLAQPMY